MQILLFLCKNYIIRRFYDIYDLNELLLYIEYGYNITNLSVILIVDKVFLLIFHLQKQLRVILPEKKPEGRKYS